ncbi:flagellar basal body L-ring protein FlgH [Buchnera aphidicola]|uniref:flagellar basal body L-ring protein FlgH n=1 Tax=Buchnera aphidicola TaxID=9 RepID=UPI0031B872B1
MKNTKFLIPIIIYVIFKIYNINNIEKSNLLEKKVHVDNTIKENNNSSIFDEKQIKEKKYGSLLDQYKKYEVGDLISVIIAENTIANNKTADNVKRYAISSLGENNIKPETNKIIKLIKNFFKLYEKSENSLFGAGQNFSENFLSGIITVTIKKILPNENLVISGEKNLVINKGNELIKFSGIINPSDIRKDNKILSTKIYNVKIEYLRNDFIKDVQKMGWWQRFILHIIPI